MVGTSKGEGKEPGGEGTEEEGVIGGRRWGRETGEGGREGTGREGRKGEKNGKERGGKSRPHGHF